MILTFNLAQSRPRPPGLRGVGELSNSSQLASPLREVGRPAGGARSPGLAPSWAAQASSGRPSLPPPFPLATPGSCPSETVVDNQQPLPAPAHICTLASSSSCPGLVKTCSRLVSDSLGSQISLWLLVPPPHPHSSIPQLRDICGVSLEDSADITLGRGVGWQAWGRGACRLSHLRGWWCMRCQHEIEPRVSGPGPNLTLPCLREPQDG